jgi:hypothetical protein
MTRILCVIAVAIAAVAASAPVAAQADASTTVFNIPGSAAVSPGTKALIQACLGEPITIVGDSLVVIHRTILLDGSSVLVIHRNPEGAFAVGSVTGTIYRIGAADTLVRIFAPSGAFDFTFTADLNVVGPGSAGGFFGHILTHITFTPSGDLTADAEIVDISCM